MKHVYFVRHGESNANADGIRRDGENTILTKKGGQQAHIVAERFKGMAIEVVLTSPYKRAYDTGKAIAEASGIELEVVGLAHERILPNEVYGKSRYSDELVQIIDEITEGWLTGNIKHPSAEGFSEIVQRVDKLREVITERSEDHIVVTSHGLFGKIFAHRVLLGNEMNAKISLQMGTHMLTSNTGITHYRIDDNDKWTLINWNDDAHLGELV